MLGGIDKEKTSNGLEMWREGGGGEVSEGT